MDKNIKAYCEDIDYCENTCISLGAKLIYPSITIDNNIKRKTYRLPHTIINLDEIKKVGSFIEIIEETENIKEFNHLIEIFNLSPEKIIPWSYEEIIKTYENARLYITELARNKKPGVLFLLDGASCSGKTTVLHDLGQSGIIKILPRYCTREPRKNINTESEYIFVSREKFKEIASKGGFIEYRNYLFGMSYGISWEEIFNFLIKGINLLGIINLGNVLHVKKIFPEAVLILIDAPLSMIEKRLIQRGFNKKEQIEERLQNAKNITFYKKYYNYIINNDDNMLKQAEEQIKKIIIEKIK
ncbi:MAG: hypothetical protein M1135_00570 [Candidatus Omnitrophica bacterium]|jgi:guanylate kinase|nr:hypothetical protein [Candidatus Omnitrophota bacterium]